MSGTAAEFIRAHENFILIAHVSPDGDTLGSSLALMWVLRRMGKAAVVVCEDGVPTVYRFLPGSGEIRRPEEALAAEAVIAVDCADLKRTGHCETLLCQAASTLNIDHHSTNTNYCDQNLVREVAATGELIYQLAADLGVPMDPVIASCLFTALVTDTGNFSYSNTTPDTLRIAAELLEAGIDLPTINRNIYRTIPLHKVKLLGLAITKTRVFENGRIGISAISLADMLQCGASGEDSEGVIDSIRDIDTVEIACLLRESETDGKIRVSLRGKRAADVSQIAIRHGGGGHKLAAGCTLDAPLEDAFETILVEAKKLLSQTQA